MNIKTNTQATLYTFVVDENRLETSDLDILAFVRYLSSKGSAGIAGYVAGVTAGFYSYHGKGLFQFQNVSFLSAAVS